MEPPQASDLPSIALILLSIGTLFLLAAYEATFTVVSRSSLERLRESAVPRSELMLRIHEPRHRLHLIVTVGQGVSCIVLTLAALSLFDGMVANGHIPIYLAAGLTLLSLMLSSMMHRLRFEIDGEESRIPRIATLFVPLHVVLSPVATLLQRFSGGDYSDEEFKADKEEELRTIVESEGDTG
ncbi:uncharacterized protein METZ01_LOCUS459339, partial [marine metagenome]